MLDSVPSRIFSMFSSNRIVRDDLVFAGAEVGYTVRILARECIGETIPLLNGYVQYIGSIVGGSMKYSI
ncbi:MAG: hypothetical protein AB8U25_06870 [Rickettsiales endosymbiont of Dermacentor nuttalli]